MPGDIDITSIYTGIKNVLATVSPTDGSTLRVYTTFPMTIDAPAVAMNVESIEYDAAMNDQASDLTISVTVLTSISSDRGEILLRGFMHTAGGSSIPAAFENDYTLGGKVAFCRIARMHAISILDWGGAQFYAAPFELEIGV